jgi:biopolymer transport protein ExbD
MEFTRSCKKRKTVNLTSLIDVIFLLVMFFLLTSKFVTSEVVDLNLSTVQGNSDVKTSQNSVEVILLKGGKFIIAQKRYDLSSLPSVISKNIQRDKTIPIVLINEKGVSVQNLVTAMDAIKMAGGLNVSIAEGSL